MEDRGFPYSVAEQPPANGTKVALWVWMLSIFFCTFAAAMIILLTLLVYFGLLMLVSHLTSQRSDNDTFFRGNRQSPWYLVAFGMIGASISGITFVSVPGMVLKTDFTYLQMCLGFNIGYFAVAFILLPVYYQLHLTTIYSYVQPVSYTHLTLPTICSV